MTNSWYWICRVWFMEFELSRNWDSISFGFEVGYARTSEWTNDELAWCLAIGPFVFKAVLILPLSTYKERSE